MEDSKIIYHNFRNLYQRLKDISDEQCGELDNVKKKKKKHKKKKKK